MKKVIIIGSGIGGLISGAFLAKSGYNVTIIEKHFIPGGYATNFVRRLPSGDNINFDVSLHGTGNLIEGRSFYERLKELGVFEKIKPLRKKETATLYYKDIKGLDIPDSFEEYKKVLISKFPEEENNIINLFNFLKKLDEDMELNVYIKNNPPKYFQELQSITLYDFLKKYTNNEDLIEVFSFLWAYYGLPPSKLNALFYLLGWISYHIGGTFYLEGGGGNFSKALAEIIEENNGKVVLKQEVVKLNSKGNKIISVETSKNEVFEGDIFIINGYIKSILNNIDNPKLVENYLNSMSELKESTSLSHLYIATDCKPEDVGITKADLFISNIDSNLGYQATLNKDYENMPLAIVNYNILDPNLNPNNGFIALTLVDLEENWPKYKTEEYKNRKIEVEEILLKRLYKLFPKLKDRIIKTEFATPHTMKRYTNNKKGAVYGFAQDVNSAGFNRLSQKTCLDNVYIASAWTQPGGGYEGAAVSGFDCARLIIENDNLPQMDTPDKELMPPNILMRGMIFQANKSYAKNLKVNYKFCFTDINEDFFISVNNSKIKLEKNLEDIDVEIKCTYETWHNIATNVTNGSLAFRQGLLKVNGDIDLFLHIQNLFESKNKKYTKENKRQLFKGEILIPLTLVPWLIYWIAGDYISPKFIGFFAILYTILISNLKPKFAKQITTLESVTILSFTIYLIIFTCFPTKNYIYFELLLPISLITSCLFEPATAQYSKWGYSDIITKNELFEKINIHITLVWAIVCIVQFIIVKIIFGNTNLSVISSPFGNFAYFLNIIVILFAIIYPKKIMSK